MFIEKNHAATFVIHHSSIPLFQYSGLPEPYALRLMPCALRHMDTSQEELTIQSVLTE